METPVSRSALYGKLAGPLFRSLESATAFCKLRSNPWVELTHWLHQLTQQPDNDILHVLRHYQIPLSDVEKALLRQLDMLPAGASAISDFSHHIDLSVEKAWMLASVRYGDNKIRSGWLLLALLTTPELRRVLSSSDHCPVADVAGTVAGQLAPVPALLDSARELSAWPELDPDAPPLTWRYGLYSVPPVQPQPVLLMQPNRWQNRQRRSCLVRCRSRQGW